MCQYIISKSENYAELALWLFHLHNNALIYDDIPTMQTRNSNNLSKVIWNFDFF